MAEELWAFNTTNLRARLVAEIDEDPDLSWRDEEQERYDEERGVTYYVFSVIVDWQGVEVSRDVLCGCGYSDIREFLTAHRDPDPLNRNSSIMRAAKGEHTAICHYFPSMVFQAITDARSALQRIRTPYLRTIT